MFLKKLVPQHFITHKFSELRVFSLQKSKLIFYDIIYLIIYEIIYFKFFYAHYEWHDQAVIVCHLEYKNT